MADLVKHKQLSVPLGTGDAVQAARIACLDWFCQYERMLNMTALFLRLVFASVWGAFVCEGDEFQ